MALNESSRSAAVLHRVGVIGDIHCQDDALELVLRYFADLSIRPVLAVGDIVDGAGDANRVCSLLAEHRVLSVSGNHDRWLLEGSMRELPDATAICALRKDAREWLAQLPKTRSFQTPRGDLLLCHGLDEDDMASLRPGEEGFGLEFNFALHKLVASKRYPLVINGHTHLPMVRTVGQLTIINAGTLDRRSRPVCSVIDFDRGNVEFFDIGLDRISSAECFALPRVERET